MSIPDLRKEYTLRGLHERDLLSDPFAQFARWFSEAASIGLIEPNAMTLATVRSDGQPSARMVLMKEFDQRGFTFYTNYESDKGADLAANPAVALSFYWPELERQVRIEGVAERVSAEEADAYYASRPLGSRLAAWASPQSRVIAGRAELEARIAEVTTRFPTEDVPRPAHWGGYRVRPIRIEFWQGRQNRLHDRMRFRREDETWVIERLAP